jgi:hypothetical protein
MVFVSSIKPSNHLSDSIVDPRRLQDLPMLSKSPSTPPLPDCCLVQYCGQFRTASDCERQDALPRTRRVYVEEPPSKTAIRTAPVAPPFFIMPPPRNHPALPPPSTILDPTAHPRPSGYGPSASSSHLHHLPPSLSLTPLNCQLLPGRMPRRCPPFSQREQGLA